MNTILEVTNTIKVTGLHSTQDEGFSLDFIYEGCSLDFSDDVSTCTIPVSRECIQALEVIRGKTFFFDVGNPEISCEFDVVAFEECTKKGIFGFRKEQILNIEAFYAPTTKSYFLIDENVWCDENRGHETEITKISAKDDGYVLTLTNGTQIFIPPEKKLEFNDSFDGLIAIIADHLMGKSAQPIGIFMAYNEDGTIEIMFDNGNVILI